MPCQFYEFQGNDEQNKSTISVLWRNINKWGAQENHYDLLIPMKEDEQNKKTLEDIFFENYKEKDRKQEEQSNYSANYIGRR
eukprot:15446293-Heterocapsa_arctica.AAC.1